MAKTTSEVVRVNSKVDIYDAEEKEILLFDEVINGVSLSALLVGSNTITNPTPVGWGWLRSYFAFDNRFAAIIPTSVIDA